jgi:hypothetical protein
VVLATDSSISSVISFLGNGLVAGRFLTGFGGTGRGRGAGGATGSGTDFGGGDVRGPELGRGPIISIVRLGRVDC